MTPIPPACTGSYPLRAGNRVRPLVDGEPAFRRICEAIEAARHRLWVTIAFVDHDAQLPDGRGTAFDVLDRAAARGLDVRVLFWREPELARMLPDSEHFGGTEREREWLRARGARFRARWDHLPHYCHHQKSWVLDAGEAGELAFVGGINPDRGSIVRPGHPPRADGPSVHDLYLEVAGPASTDVAHNFVQRWNQASERARPDGCWPDADAAGPLPFPSRLSPPAGDVPVQIARTIRANIYTAGAVAPDAAPLPVAEGEASILEQYLAAIDGARQGIYVENQFLGSPVILQHLAAAVARGVEVVFVLPGAPMDAVRDTRAQGGRATLFFDALAALDERPNFTLAALATSDNGGAAHDVYVHAKMMLVDDAWATIGSANILTRSFHADTELNASFWHPDTVHALRTELLAEHLGVDTARLTLSAALRLFAERARRNRAARSARQPLAGLAWALDGSRYGLEQASG